MILDCRFEIIVCCEKSIVLCVRDKSESRVGCGDEGTPVGRVLLEDEKIGDYLEVEGYSVAFIC